jgi:hypothetical protein
MMLGGCVKEKPGVILEKPVLVTTTSDATMFPEQWRKEPIAATGREIAASQMLQAREVMGRALNKYPAKVIEEHLKAVYVLSELRYSGIAAGGTNSRVAVYVQMGNRERRYTDGQIERIFHAEFSSILLRNFAKQFDEAAWRACHPEGFTYLGSGVEAIKQKKARVWTGEELLAEGFLSEYGKSTMENDFNGYTAALWCGDGKLWKAAEQHGRVKRKLELTIRLYEKIDAGMSEGFFRGLARD